MEPSMLEDKLKEVFNEPGCAINNEKESKDRKKGCTKTLKPGAAAGG
jgi:nitrogenase molybdenum-cofactor synthesis protein NifE